MIAEMSDPPRDVMPSNHNRSVKLTSNMSAANVKLSDIPSYPFQAFLSIGERFRELQKAYSIVESPRVSGV